MSLKLPSKNGGPNSGITALLDCDVIVYACGFSSQHNIHTVTLVGEDEPRASFQYKKEMKTWLENEGLKEGEYTVNTRIEVEPVENALHSVKLFINDILEKTNAQFYKGYLTGKGNFRDDVATILPYKGNRDNLHKPVHYDAIRQYLIDVWGAEVVEGMEADDLLAIEQTKFLKGELEEARKHIFGYKFKEATVICSIDKDLKQVPGWHYNWNKDEAPVWVSEEEALHNFYMQLLTGDMTDNIQGIPGVGPKKAEKILEGCKTEEDMYVAALNAYQEYKFPNGVKHPQQLEEVRAELEENAHLLYMIRELGKDGTTPKYWRAPE